MHHLGKIFRFGWPYLRRYWLIFAAAIAFAIVYGLSNGALVWGTKTILERLTPHQQIAESEQRPAPLLARSNPLERITHRAVDAWLPQAGRPLDARQVIGGLLVLPLLVGLRGVARYLSAYCMSWVSEHVVADLRGDMLEKLSSLSLDYFNRSTSGDLLTRINGDTAALNRCLSIGFTSAIKEPFTMLSIFAVLCAIDWKLTLCTMVLMPLCLIPLNTLGRKSRRAGGDAGEASILQSSLVVEMLSGIRLVKALGIEAEQVARFRTYSDQIIRAALKTVKAREQINPIIETIAMFGLGLLILYVFVAGRTMAEMVGFLSGMLLFFLPVKRLAALHLAIENSKFGVDRLAQILREEPTVAEARDAKPLTRFDSGIRLRAVTFSYENRDVLQEIDLHIPRGSKLGVAGENGSGKSTLVNLLLRFHDPVGGVVEIDGTNLRDVSLRDLRRLIALVSQEVVIFDQTVAENIGCAKPGASQAAIEKAARAADAHDFITQLPHGYETRVGERGVLLSGGQRQRISIARAFIRDAPILILDEATASLDPRGETEIQTAVDRLEENRTVVCVSHRLSTLASMDEIIVLEHGRIIERGTFAALLRESGWFAEMAKRQGITADHSPQLASSLVPESFSSALPVRS
jgi:subfamily B ATP-binding cassette protein MsbA